VTHRDDAALAHEADDGVVGARAARGRVDDDEDVLVLGELERARGEHGVDVDLAEDLLEAVEREARELGLDEVRAVLRKKIHLTWMSVCGYIILRCYYCSCSAKIGPSGSGCSGQNMHRSS